MISSARSQDLRDRVLVERLEEKHPGTGQERGVQLEGRVLGGGADQRDGAVLHHGQEGIELGAVEAVDLVHEEQRALAVERRWRAASKTFFRSATPEKIAEICSKWRSVSWASSRATVVLPVPGGPQKIREPRVFDAMRRVRIPSGPDQMVLADDLGEVLRPHPVGQRTRCVLVEAGG